MSEPGKPAQYNKTNNNNTTTTNNTDRKNCNTPHNTTHDTT